MYHLVIIYTLFHLWMVENPSAVLLGQDDLNQAEATLQSSDYTNFLDQNLVLLYLSIPNAVDFSDVQECYYISFYM